MIRKFLIWSNGIGAGMVAAACLYWLAMQALRLWLAWINWTMTL